MGTPEKDKLNTATDSSAPREENAFQGISVDKFISHLEAKGVDLKTAKVKVFYKDRKIK